MGGGALAAKRVLNPDNRNQAFKGFNLTTKGSNSCSDINVGGIRAERD